MNTEEEESTLSRLTQLMRVGVPYDQLERELKFKGCAPKEVTRILDIVKTRLRGSPVKRDMGYGDTFTEDSSYFALPGLSFDMTDDVKTKLEPSTDNQVDIGEGFLRKIGISRDQAKFWMYNTDPLENDSRFKHFVKLTGVGVPKETIAAKMSREGVDVNMITKFSQLSAFRKRIKVRSAPTPAPSSSNSDVHQSGNSSRYSTNSKHGTTPAPQQQNNSKNISSNDSGKSHHTPKHGPSSPQSSNQQRGRSSYQAVPPPPSSQTMNNSSSSHRTRSYSANNAPSIPFNSKGLTHNHHSQTHHERSFDAPISSSFHSTAQAPSSYLHGRENQYENNRYRSMSVSDRHKIQPPSLSSSSHFGSKSIKSTYDHYEYSNAVKNSGDLADLPSSSYRYPSKDTQLEVDSIDYGQSGFGGTYGTSHGSSYQTMKTPEKKKKEKPWQRPTPYSPTSDMYRSSPGSKETKRPQVNFGGDRASSSSVPVYRDVTKDDTRAMLKATGLSKEVVETLAGALGGSNYEPDPQTQNYEMVGEGYIAHRGRMASNESVNQQNTRGKSVDDVARSESDRHRALLEHEADRLDQLWHEFSHRRHNSLGRRSNEDVRFSEMTKSSSLPPNESHNIDNELSNNENNKHVGNINKENMTERKHNIKFSPSTKKPHQDEARSRTETTNEQYKPLQKEEDNQDHQENRNNKKQDERSRNNVGSDDLVMMEELAKSMSILARTNCSQTNETSSQQGQALGLKEVLVEAHMNVKKLVKAKQSVERDLAELQESVTRSSSLLIERATQQQVEFEGKEERIRALEMRLKEAGELLEETREHAGRAASSVAAGEQQLLEEAEKMVERQQCYIGELEDRIEKYNKDDKQNENTETSQALQTRKELEELKAALEAAGRNMTMAEQEFETERMELNHLVQLKTNELSDLRSESIQLKECNDKLRRQVTTLLETNINDQGLSDDLALQSKGTSTLSSSRGSKHQNNDNDGGVNDEDMVGRMNKDLKEINENLTYSLKKCEEELSKSTTHCKKLEHTNRDLRKEMEELREDTALQLEQETAAKEEIRKQWTESAQRAEKGLASLRAEHERFLSVQSSGLNAAEDSERKLREENDQLTHELGVAKKQYTGAMSAKQAAETRCAMLTNQIEQSSDHLVSSDGNLTALKAEWDSERSSFKETIASLKQKLERTSNLVATEREACFEARKAAAAADNARLTLEDEHLSARVTIKQLQVSAAQQDRTIRDLERKVSSANVGGPVSTARDSVRESVRESALQREVNALKDELELTRSEHERDCKRMKDLEQDIISLNNRKSTALLPPRKDSDDDIQRHKERLFEAQHTDEEKDRLLTQVAELESLLDSRTRELRLAQSTLTSRNAISNSSIDEKSSGEAASLKRQVTQSASTITRLETEVDQLRARLLAKEEEDVHDAGMEDISLPSLGKVTVGTDRKVLIGSHETPLLEFVLSTNEKVRELKQQTESTKDEIQFAQITQQIEELQLKSTRCMMSFLKSCVISLTKKELGHIGRVVDRAYDSRSCANMIKEGYQGVKKVLFKSQRSRAAGRNEEWNITPENLASASLHREMLPSLSLMVVGFDNLAPPYHAKIAKSQELNLNMHWIVRIGDVVAKAKLSRVSQQRKPSPDPAGGAMNSQQDRGRARSRSGQTTQNPGSANTRSASAGSARNRSVSVSTRFSVGSNDDYDENS